MSIPTKTFDLLSLDPKIPIEKCSEILDNNLQCWNASAVLVTVTVGAVVTVYQKCRRHAVLEEIVYKRELAEQEAIKPVTPKPPTTPTSTPALKK